MVVRIAFTAAVPEWRKRGRYTHGALARNPDPDNQLAVNSANVTITGCWEAIYTGYSLFRVKNTFSSFLPHVATRDVYLLLLKWGSSNTNIAEPAGRVNGRSVCTIMLPVIY